MKFDFTFDLFIPWALACFNVSLAGVPGIAQDDQWRNLIASFFLLYNKKGGQ